MNRTQWIVFVLGLAVAMATFFSLSNFHFIPGSHSVSHTINPDKSTTTVDQVIGPTIHGTAPFGAMILFVLVVGGTGFFVVKIGRRSSTQNELTPDVIQSGPDVWPPALKG